MVDKMIHVRLREDIWKQYKHVCIELDLSLVKQTESLIENFVNVQYENLRVKRQLNKMKNGNDQE